MGWRWIVPLGVAAIFASLGFGLRSGEAMASLANVLIALGMSLGACVAALSVAVVLRPKRSALEPKAVERINDLVADLIAASEAVDRRGILALAEVSVRHREALFRHGATRAIAAAEPELIRNELADLQARAAGGSTRRARSRVFVARAAASISLGAGLIVTLQSVLPLLAGDASTFSDAHALAILMFTYAGCLMVIVGHSLSDRAAVGAREHELAGALVTEAILQFRAGAPRTQVREALDRLTAPSMPPARTGAAPSRAAA